MNAKSLRRRMAGFTIIELMVVVGIVAILAAVAAPNLGGMIRTQRVKTASFDVYSSLTFARSEAIKRNTTVTLTPTAGGTDWGRGWTIRDANNNLLRQQAGWYGAGEAPTITMAGPATVTFAGSGRLSGAALPIGLSADTYYNQTVYRCVTLDLSGRATTREIACPPPPP